MLRRFSLPLIMAVFIFFAAGSVFARDVVQTIFNAKGKPASNMKVMCTYCVDGHITYRSMVTDHNAQVTWKNLPDSRIIVWGDSIPAGVIEPGVATVTAPLPGLITPKYQQEVEVTFNIPLKTVASGAVTTIFRDADSGNRGGYPQYVNLPAGQPFRYTQRIAPATRYSILVALPGEPQRIAVLNNVYLPYTDKNRQQAAVSVETSPAVMLECRFRVNGRTLPRVNRIDVWPVKVTEQILPSMDGLDPTADRLLKPRHFADGYRIMLPGAGRYRVLVDLFDETTVPFPGSVIDVPKEGKTVEIELPAPLFSVPPGTEVGWTTRHAPGNIHKLIAAAGQSPVPVFGPRDGLTAAWYSPLPDTLDILHGDGNIVRHSLQQATLTVVSTEKSASYSTMLLPLLGYGLRGKSFDNDRLPINSHVMGRNLNYGANDLPTIWSGSYLAYSGWRLIPCQITEGGENAITLDNTPLQPGNPLNPHLRQMKFHVMEDAPSTNGTGQRYSGERSRFIEPFGFVFADRGSTPIATLIIRRGGTEMQPIPLNTKTLTVYAPGLGIIPDIPVPPADDPAAQIEVRNWQPGVAIMGQLFDRAGKPLARKPIEISMEFGGRLNDTTGETGEFRFENLLPGTVFIHCTVNDKKAVWSLQVPVGGQDDIRLTMQDGVTINTGGYRHNTWWFPEKGKPTRLSIDGVPSVVCGLTLGPGLFWCGSDQDAEVIVFRKLTLEPGASIAVNDGREIRAGSYLGLSFPLMLGKSVPGDVELTGMDSLSGFHLHFAGLKIWHPCAEIGKILGQLGPLPPGKYRVTIDTDTGQVIREVSVTEYGAYVEMHYPE